MPIPDLIRRLPGVPAKPPTGDDAASPPPAPGRTARSDDAFAVSPHSRRQARGWRWAAGIALALLLFAGFRVVVLEPVLGAVSTPDAPPPAAAPLDPAAAAALATAYAADYWSFTPDDPSRRAAALARWTGTSTATAANLAGRGRLRADLVTAGATTASGPDVLIVQTTARVTPAAAPANTGTDLRPAAAATDGPVPPYAADPGPATAPWVTGTPMWLTLDVVVQRADGALRVATATLSGDAPVALPRPTSEVDARLTGSTSTAKLPAELFGALADSDLGYLTTPHVQLAGLSKAVALAGVTGWSVATDRADNGTRYATADVTWRLTGTELQLTQPYALSMTETDGRWLLGAVGPRLEETP